MCRSHAQHRKLQEMMLLSVCGMICEVMPQGAPALEQAGLLGTEENSTDCQQFLSSDSDLPAYKEQSTTLSVLQLFSIVESVS